MIWLYSLFVLLLVTISHAGAQGEFSGFVALDTRAFLDHPMFPDQRDDPIVPSIVMQPEYRHEWNDGNDRFTAVPFIRLEGQDSRRRHIDIRELNWLHIGTSWDLLFGVSKVFWGVTESQHLVDIINQTDFVEDIDTEDKLGQPMLRFSWDTSWGNWTFFFLPRFRERTFPGRRGRLRAALPVDTSQPIYDTDLEAWHPDLAVRWAHTLGDWDIGLAHFSGVSREPRLLPGFDTNQNVVLIPHYDVIHQTSLDLQVTMGSWLIKLEALTRAGHGRRFAALVTGFEYTFYGLAGSSIDLGVLAEYLYDDRSRNAPLTPSADDFFVGVRLGFNDTQDTNLLTGAIVDRKTQATLFSVELQRRLGDRLTLELETRFFLNISESDGLFSLRRDDYIQLRLALFL